MTPEELEELTERIKTSCGMVGEMCSEGRPPKMSIPVQDKDEDVYICATLHMSLEKITELTQKLEDINDT